MDLELRGASALVTGGGRGMGLAIALALAESGVDVAICGRTAERLDAAKQEIEQFGVKAVTLQRDLTEPGACADVVDAAADQLGRLDILVNDVANDVGDVDMTASALLSRLTGKTMIAAECSLAAVRHIAEAGQGSIVMVGGTSARQALTARETGAKGSTMAAGFSNSALASMITGQSIAVDGGALRAVNY